MLVNENGIGTHLFVILMNIFLWLLVVGMFIGIIGFIIACIKDRTKDGIKGRHTTIEIKMNDKEKTKWKKYLELKQNLILLLMKTL